MSWDAWAQQQVSALKRAQRWRENIPFDSHGPQGTRHDRTLISFASNDYLGLSTHPAVCLAAADAIAKFGVGAGASRLVTGTRSQHVELEETLAQWQRTERALVFPTGYAANLAALSVLGTSDVTIFSDQLNHASIIDGCRLAKARTEVYRHCDIDHLEGILRPTKGRKIVVSDLVFSMDGDIAPVSELAMLCAQHGALLVLDEAHAALEPIRTSYDCEVLHIGTLSKTLGSMGGWVAGTNSLIDLLINRGRSYIYTTALSMPDTAAALAALRIYTSAEGETLRARLLHYIDQLKPVHRSPIVPVILGSDHAALQAAAYLLEQGIHVPAIRPPTVPEGTARLRVTLSAAHSQSMIDHLLRSLQQLVLSLQPCPIALHA